MGSGPRKIGWSRAGVIDFSTSSRPVSRPQRDSTVDCKPGPVSLRGCPHRAEDHSSRRRVAAPLEHSHPSTGTTHPRPLTTGAAGGVRGAALRTGRPGQHPYSSLLPEGLASPPVTRLSRVGSYPTISPLPVPDHLAALASCSADRPSAVSFLLRFPSGRPGSVLPTSVPCGARTFLPRTVSVRRRSSVHLRQGQRRSRVARQQSRALSGDRVPISGHPDPIDISIYCILYRSLLDTDPDVRRSSLRCFYNPQRLQDA